MENVVSFFAVSVVSAVVAGVVFSVAVDDVVRFVDDVVRFVDDVVRFVDDAVASDNVADGVPSAVVGDVVSFAVDVASFVAIPSVIVDPVV